MLMVVIAAEAVSLLGRVVLAKHKTLKLSLWAAGKAGMALTPRAPVGWPVVAELLMAGKCPKQLWQPAATSGAHKWKLEVAWSPMRAGPMTYDAMDKRAGVVEGTV
jgi:hypothetical protein